MRFQPETSFALLADQLRSGAIEPEIVDFYRLVDKHRDHQESGSRRSRDMTGAIRRHQPPGKRRRIQHMIVYNVTSYFKFTRKVATFQRSGQVHLMNGDFVGATEVRGRFAATRGQNTHMLQWLTE
eukprot:TRINITY_DN16479_c0_g1_i1.p1 TRINITY_DN16479_c0_g1~~TRINITY_DN16479_c0_g1_i1.p1  ORF type:complete len:126 (+),score=5.82 TRINITY_DN16479_c0_g1_i1:325-702(+)